MNWLARWLGRERPKRLQRPRPPPGDAFGAMMACVDSLPAEGFELAPLAHTHPRPRRRFRFAPTASVEHAHQLVEAIAPGQALEFFDAAFPSVSDPGGFVTAARGPGGAWGAEAANHGWHAGWQAIDGAVLADYLWACQGPWRARAEEGSWLSTGPAPPGSSGALPEADPGSPFLREVRRRINAAGLGPETPPAPPA